MPLNKITVDSLAANAVTNVAIANGTIESVDLANSGVAAGAGLVPRVDAGRSPDQRQLVHRAATTPRPGGRWYRQRHPWHNLGDPDRLLDCHPRGGGRGHLPQRILQSRLVCPVCQLRQRRFSRRAVDH